MYANYQEADVNLQAPVSHVLVRFAKIAGLILLAPHMKHQKPSEPTLPRFVYRKATETQLTQEFLMTRFRVEVTRADAQQSSQQMFINENTQLMMSALVIPSTVDPLQVAFDQLLLDQIKCTTFLPH